MEEDLYHLEDHARQLFGMDCVVLMLILSQNDKPVFLDPQDQFDDLYGPLSIVLAQNQVSQAGQGSEIEVKDNKSVKDFWRSLYQYKATLLIFTANLICFILTEICGDKIYDSFACNAYMVKKLHEYYRLFTSNYLHFGWDHFFNNMAVFLLLGSSLEKVIGSVRYVILYTGAGIAGSIISVAYYSMIGQDVLSAGASGAIFGLVGALAAIFFILQMNELISKASVTLRYTPSPAPDSSAEPAQCLLKRPAAEESSDYQRSARQSGFRHSRSQCEAV